MTSEIKKKITLETKNKTTYSRGGWKITGKRTFKKPLQNIKKQKTIEDKLSS